LKSNANVNEKNVNVKKGLLVKRRRRSPRLKGLNETRKPRKNA
jgi:hypothetical protein